MVIPTLFTRVAREYLSTVRDRFQDNREIYDKFIKIMKDFNSKRIGDRDVRSKVIELFKGHQDLIFGFNMFLPRCCYTITLKSDQTPPMMSEFREAVDFIKKVKAKLQDDAFKSFLETLRMYREEKKSVTEVIHEVFDVLFRDHHDLRVEFSYFLPRNK